MTCTVLYGGQAKSREVWRSVLEQSFAEIDLNVNLYMHSSEIKLDQVDYLLCQSGGTVDDYSVFPRLKALLSLWAGVEWLVSNPSLPEGVPIVRMVEDGMTLGMSDYVAGHVLRYHLDIDANIAGTTKERWGEPDRPLSEQRRVGILGMGVLGTASAKVLRAIGFDVAGWSRSRKSLRGVRSYAGTASLDKFLARTDILVVLLPLTPETIDLVDAAFLSKLPEGACVVNAARGPIIHDGDLLAALDSGQIAHATLDVFRTEPLPPKHPYWRHPRVTVTPHIASATRFDSASRSIARQISRLETGMALEHVVDRSLGY